MEFDVQSHWNSVAGAISTRNSGTQLAGYDSVLDRYSRAKFMKFFPGIDVQGKSVMEVGSGSGLNLQVLDQGQPRSITAVDISEKMLELAKAALRGAKTPAQFIHIDGKNIPLPAKSIDCAFTVTVLQHNSNVAALKALAGSIANVTREKICLFEDTAPVEKGTPDYMLRPVEFYKNMFEAYGFRLVRSEYISMYYTQKVFSLFNRIFGLYSKKEGASASTLERCLQYPFLPLTIMLDKVIPRREGNTLMVFERIG